jgi:putative membrane protein
MLLTRLVINGVALIVAALLVPDIKLKYGSEPAQTLITLGVLAVVFAVINSYLRPLLRVLSLPINLLTVGLFSFALSAGMLVLLAWITDLAWQPVIRLGGFPPDLSIQTLVAAVLGSIVISTVSTVMALLLPSV